MIPPLVSFPNIDAFKVALLSQYSERERAAPKVVGYLENADNLHAAGLPPLVSNRAMSMILGVSPRLIPAITVSPHKYWRIFEIKKKSGGVRRIISPRVFLKTIQNYILQTILIHRKDHLASFGFSKGKGALSNATIHQGRKYIWNTDIQDFFPSITENQVFEVFSTFGFSLDMQRTLSQLCTYGHRLPQGAPTSPKLSNLVFKESDEQLTALAESYGAIYSRYADDITFSTNHLPHASLMVGVREILRARGFLLNSSKTRLTGPREARTVTGFVINEKVHPNRKTRRNLRAKFHSLPKNTNLTLEDLQEAQGWASYVHSYDKATGRRYLDEIRLIRQIVESSGPKSTDPELN